MKVTIRIIDSLTGNAIEVPTVAVSRGAVQILVEWYRARMAEIIGGPCYGYAVWR